MGQRKTSAGKAAAKTRSADRRREVALRLRAGESQQEIAQALAVSEGTISGDKERLLAAWRDEEREDIAAILGTELAALDGDELALRLRLALQADDRVAVALYRQILRIMDKRATWLGYGRPLGESSKWLDEVLDEMDQDRDRAAGLVEGSHDGSDGKAAGAAGPLAGTGVRGAGGE